ncbi:MAG TPA: TIR domain-containing protein [Candidatus Baltobacteraceae bacterium]|nr:TIR domain-containing protein [Candidatus Baltobacteraceae bacterium]
MSSGATYVIFDGDKDHWAYAFMKGWKVNDRVEFDFRDAHDIGSMTGRAEDEEYVKSELRKRMKASSQVVVLVGESTKYLQKFVGWEINLALELDLPIIVVNLNEKRNLDSERCPVPLRTGYIVHIAFKRAIIKYALENFPGEFASRDRNATEPRNYSDEVYRKLGL